MIGRQQKLVGKLRMDFPTAAGTAGRIIPARRPSEDRGETMRKKTHCLSRFWSEGKGCFPDSVFPV